MCFREFEQVGFSKTEEPGNDQLWKLVDPDVVRVDAVVVELAPVRDAFLQFGYAPLQFQERFAGLEFGIVLDDRKQSTETRAKTRLRIAERIQIGFFPCRVNCAARPHHVLERIAFVAHVSFAGLDEFRQFIVSLYQQYVDVRPVLTHVLTQEYEAVVDDDEVN